MAMADFAGIRKQFPAITERAQKVSDRLGPVLFTRSPAPDRWSAAECLLHLQSTAEAYQKDDVPVMVAPCPGPPIPTCCATAELSSTPKRITPALYHRILLRSPFVRRCSALELVLTAAIVTQTRSSGTRPFHPLD